MTPSSTIAGATSAARTGPAPCASSSAARASAQATAPALAWLGGESALGGVAAALVLAAFNPATRLTVRKAVALLESTGRSLLDMAAITGVAGFIIGALQLSGLGFKLSLALTTLASGNLFVLLLLTAAAATVLGMTMPTTAVYILLAPAIVELGVTPLAAHLFVFYFGILSMITPPVCLATYTAASLARADFWRAGWAGMRLGGRLRGAVPVRLLAGADPTG